jgi:hypothetical protein
VGSRISLTRISNATNPAGFGRVMDFDGGRRFAGHRRAQHFALLPALSKPKGRVSNAEDARRAITILLDGTGGSDGAPIFALSGPSPLGLSEPRLEFPNLQQTSCRHFECLRKLIEDEDCRVPDTAFNAADIGPVQPRFERQIFLRPTPLLAHLSHVEPHQAPDIHAPAGRICGLSIYGL